MNALIDDRIRRAGIQDIAAKIFASERISPADGVRLFQTEDLNLLGALADHVRRQRHGDAAFYNINQRLTSCGYNLFNLGGI